MDRAELDVEAARERIRDLEARVRELEARLKELVVAGDSASAADAPDPRTAALFARLREHHEAAAAEAPQPPKPSPARPSEPAPLPPPPAAVARAGDSGDEPGPEPEPEPEPDEGLRAQRDAVLDPLVTELLGVSKRQLQDEQNVLLDAVRRAKERLDVANLLPEPAQHLDAWTVLVAPSLDTAYTCGRTAFGRSRKPTEAPERLVHDLVTGLVVPLRERVLATVSTVLARGPYQSAAELHRELASAVGARYREWKGGDLEARLGDALAAAYVRGTYDGAPSGASLRWVSDTTQRCPDCDDNALEPTVKGQHFPTGQPHPPAHPGCRCLLAPVGIEE